MYFVLGLENTKTSTESKLGAHFKCSLFCILVVLSSSCWLFGSFGGDCARVAQTSAATLCWALLGVSGKILPDSDTLSQRKLLKFCASALQAECRGDIFSDSLRVKNILEKFDFSETNDHSFKEWNYKFLALGILKFSGEM